MDVAAEDIETDRLPAGRPACAVDGEKQRAGRKSLRCVFAGVPTCDCLVNVGLASCKANSDLEVAPVAAKGSNEQDTMVVPRKNTCNARNWGKVACVAPSAQIHAGPSIQSLVEQ